ncbi:hypothetical protein L202_03118 [Cryptococcus amylolentus CBS 6039]|uniref:Major facilitator superfamily (MFS) profile domain-containing protein n=1 Tax=Cryptococcus amylolentus CBS 6039 TaxID=1295533 RepID=A0A1E3HXN6_9TREE|nr:hypothetical protein L202_03118 [Cryptococcus amylolentus CBS 6039]ODN81017.1 hypothetical protein L202_03118 [Cryptococcus amylolentus CBS 6039]
MATLEISNAQVDRPPAPASACSTKTLAEAGSPVLGKSHTFTHSNDPHDTRDVPSDAVSKENGNEELAAKAGKSVKIPQGRKWFLLFLFSMAQYLDLSLYSAAMVFTDVVTNELGIIYESSTWVVTAYVVTFSSFLLFWGRVADLYSPQVVFSYGFLFLGVFSLILSFMPNQYGFFVFRALSGICGAATTPSAYRLIMAVFEPEELHLALTCFIVTGPIAGFGAALVIPFAVYALFGIPKDAGLVDHKDLDNKERFKRVDLVGCLLMLSSIILFVLGLTLGSSFGWKKAGFLVPFLLSWPLMVLFFLWESRLPEGYALIPPRFWKIRNATLVIWISIGIYPFWAVTQLALIERSLSVFDELPIVAAARVLPHAVSGAAIALILPSMLKKITNLRWMIVGCPIVAGLMYLPLIYFEGEIFHNAYWRWWFPAMFVGSSVDMVLFLSCNIVIMTSAPPDMSGVAGALFQVSLQLGTVIGLSVQAGLLTLHPGGMTNFTNVQASFWFVLGWLLLNALICAVFYR